MSIRSQRLQWRLALPLFLMTLIGLGLCTVQIMSSHLAARQFEGIKSRFDVTEAYQVILNLCQVQHAQSQTYLFTADESARKSYELSVHIARNAFARYMHIPSIVAVLKIYEDWEKNVVGDFRIMTVRDSTEKSFTALIGSIDSIKKEERNQLEIGIGDRQKLDDQLVIVAVVFAVLLVGCSTGCFLFMRYGIVRPLGRQQDTLLALSRGEQSHVIGELDRKDEIGDLARSAYAFRQSLHERTLLSESVSLENEKRAQRQTKLDRAILTFKDINATELASSRSQVAHLSTAADDLNSTSEQAHRKVLQTSEAVTVVTHSIVTVASATEEMRMSIDEITSQTTLSVAAISAASGAASIANRKLDDLQSAITSIGSVTQLITAVAAQTNLLALNATIEAARAGSAGKGFGVVALEVKALAGQTTNATEAISRQIEDVKGAAEGTVNAIRSIVNCIQDMNQLTALVAQAIKQQNFAADEIARNASKAASSADGLNGTVAALVDVVKAAQVAAEKSQSASSDVHGGSLRVHQSIVEFLEAVEAA